MSWKKKVGIALVVILAVLVLLAGAVYFYVQTPAFNRFALNKIVEETQAATGARMRIGRVDIHWRKLGVDFYNVILYGRQGETAPPLLRADHLGVGLKIVSFLKRDVDLAEIILDRPVLNLRVDAKGQTNIPQSNGSKNTANPVDTLFKMAIGHVLVTNGQIDYNDQQTPLIADLSYFRADIKFGFFSRNYTGSVAYSRGRIVAGSFNPIEHSAQLDFAATPSQLDLNPVTISAGKSHITAHAILFDYNNPRVQGTYDAIILTPELATILKEPSIPSGQVAATGSLRYQNQPGRSFLASLYADGRIASPELLVRSGGIATSAKSVRGAFTLENGNLRVPNLDADLFQGHVNANAQISDLTGKAATRINATVRNVSLDRVTDTLPRGSYERVRATGQVNAQAQASWSGTIDNIQAQAHVTIVSPAAKQPSGSVIPLNGVLDVRYDGARSTIAFGQSHLQTGATQLALSGTVSKQSNLSVQANTTDLHELSALITEIGAATAKPSASTQPQPARPLDIHGSARFSGQASGAAKDPHIQGQLLANDVEVEGSRWRTIRANIDAGSSRVAVQNGSLQSLPRGDLEFSASVGLADWSLTPSSPISIHATGSNLSVAALERLGKEHYPVDGTLSANISIDGTKQNPSGRGSIQVTKATAWEEPVNNLSLNFQASGASIQSTLALQIPAGSANANVTFNPASERYDAKLTTSGLKLDQIHEIQAQKLDLAGILNASVQGQGTLKDPQLSGNFQVSQLRFHGQSVSSADATLAVANQHANFTLHSVVAQGDVSARGDVALAGDYNTNAALDVRSVPIGAVLATYIPGAPPDLQGQTEIHATLSGPLKDPERVQAHVEIPTFTLAYQSANLALVEPLRLDYRQGVATIQETEFKGNGTDLKLQGVIPVKGSSTASFNIAANGGVDLSLIQGFTRSIQSSGRVDLNITGSGDFKNPDIKGQVKVENAYFSSESTPLGVEGINGQINVAGRRLDVSQFSGKAGGGTIALTGFMLYGSQSEFNLSLQANSVRLRYPQGLRSILNCNLQLTGSTAASNLTGRVLIDRLSFTQQFDLANFAGQFTSGSSSSSSSPFEQNMRLSVAVQSAQDLNLASSQVSMQGSANLNVTGTLANPVVLGRATLTGGDVFFLGKRYDVQSGTIEFANPVRTQPVLNLNVKTTVEQYDLTLNFTGPVDRLRTTYTSDPPLPPSDIISLLALGTTAEESATSTTPASLGAESVVANGVASQFSGALQKFAGISQLTIDPLAASNTTNPGAQLSIQQRVTGNLLLTFSTDVTSTQATAVQLQYKTTKQTSVTVLRDQYGGYAIDFRVHKTF